MRLVERHTERQTIRLTEDQKDRFKAWVTYRLTTMKAVRWQWDAMVRDLLRTYEGVPLTPIKHTPIENAPNFEITLAAIAADAIYAQALDLIYTVSPILTARATNEQWVEHAKGVQAFINWGMGAWGLRNASEHFLLDDVQLGSGVYYIPWVQHRIKTKTAKISQEGPFIRVVPIEDFFVEGGAGPDLQREPMIGQREWLTEMDLAERAEAPYNWNTDGFAPGEQKGWVRSYRETLGRTSSSQPNLGNLFEVFHLYCQFDIDEDGLPEDLYAVVDGTTFTVAAIDYAPFDLRPFEAARYQLRAHLFYGIGVLEMLREFQRGVTDLYNHWITNAMIANARIWKARRGALGPSPRFWPNKVIELDDPNSLKAEQMGDTYPSLPQAIAVTISLAERRSGVNEMSLPRPSQVLGSRTPGITALSMLQQVNRRFTPAFDAIRLATAGAVRQCLWRYKEQLLAGNTEAERTLVEVLGAEDASKVAEVLRREDFDQAIHIELTASSASVNRDADRQNALLLVNILGQYYEKVLQLVTIATNPQVPKPVKDVAAKIAQAAGEAIDRTIRTFDQMRDPRTFIIDVEAQVDQAAAGANPEGLQGLAQLMQTFAQNGQTPVTA